VIPSSPAAAASHPASSGSSSTPRRLLLVTHYYVTHGGGVEAIAAELARRLVQRGESVRWMASRPARGEALAAEPAREAWDEVPVRAWNVTEDRLGFPYPLWGPGALLRLWREVGHCDLVHIHDSLYPGCAAAALFARWRGRPVVVTQHIGFVPYASRVLRGALEGANRTLARNVLGHASCCVFYSPKVSDYFSRRVRFRRPPRFIPNGVDTGVFRPLGEPARAALRAELGWPADRPVLLFVGRFVEKKGLAVLRRVAERLPGPLWVFVGWGPLDPASWGLPHVKALGSQGHRELARIYQAADLLVLPSVGEGFPLVVQESMACGTPALITPDTLAGAPEVAAVTITADPEPVAFADALAGLLEAPADLRGRRAAVAARARELWSWESATDRYAELFAELAPGAARQGAA
jgi:phosphatidylinositol alpha-1,6-mannosyltransferase